MGRGRTCQSFRHVRPPAAFCLQRYFNFARNWCFRGCFMPRRRWGDKWVYSIIFINRYFGFLLCAIAQRREGSRAVLVLWSTPACPIGDRAAQSLATVFASYLFIHRFARKRFSFATEKHGGLAFSEVGLSTKECYLCILAHTSKVRTPSIVSFATIIPHLITF